ncbi:MAG: hypothetical protein U0930_22925 [Pirellulales bacterium]
MTFHRSFRKQKSATRGFSILENPRAPKTGKGLIVLSRFVQIRFGVWSLISAITLSASFTGCSGGGSVWEKTYPVSGVVTHKGQPITDAEIAFFPVDKEAPETVRPKAKSTAGGKFTVWTYNPGDGAPAGKYKVTVVHNEVAVSKDTIVAKPNDLPQKYAGRDSTDLEIQIVAGSNESTSLSLK